MGLWSWTHIKPVRSVDERYKGKGAWRNQRGTQRHGWYLLYKWGYFFNLDDFCVFLYCLNQMKWHSDDNLYPVLLSHQEEEARQSGGGFFPGRRRMAPRRGDERWNKSLWQKDQSRNVNTLMSLIILQVMQLDSQVERLLACQVSATSSMTLSCSMPWRWLGVPHSTSVSKHFHGRVLGCTHLWGIVSAQSCMRSLMPLLCPVW